MSTTANVLSDITAERKRQDAKWGEQNHPDGTGSLYYRAMAQMAKAECQESPQINGEDRYSLILLEEVYEALAESDAAKLREELIQVAAVAVAWVEKIDREHA